MKLTRTKEVLCIDPGTTHSGVVIFDGKNVLYVNSSFENDVLVEFCKQCKKENMPKEMVIEGIASYGMAVGETTFETVEWQVQGGVRIFQHD